MPVFLAYQTATAATPSQQDRLEVFTVAGVSQGSVTIPAQSWRLVRDGDGVVLVPVANQDVQRFNDTPTESWDWTPDDSSFTGWDAYPTGSNADVWMLRPNLDSLHRIDNTGMEQEQIDDVRGASSNPPISFTLSQDGNYAFTLTSDGEVEGIDLSDGSVLWTVTPEATAADVPNTQSEYLTIRRIPSTDSLIVATAKQVGGTYNIGVLVRLDFSGAVTSAPTEAWSHDWTDDHTQLNKYVTSLVVTSDAIYAGGVAAVNTGESNAHILTKLDLDGNVSWRHSASNYETDGTQVAWRGAIAYDSGYLVVGVESDTTTFPTEWYGWVRLDASDGSKSPAGVFPLESYYVYNAAGVASTDADPLAPTSDGTDQRVYAQVSRTAGSLLDALDAPAVEDGIRMGFFPDEGLTLGELVPFYEAFAPSEVRHRFYAFPVPSQNHLNEYVGGTKLGRMRKAYPSRFVAAAADLPLGSGGTLTPKNLLAELFNAWEGEFDWFTYESPLPDLRYRTPTQDYTSASAGLVEFDAIVLEQDEEAGERLSMRAILDRFLALFPGTAIIQKANGDIALRPTYGPDAPSSSTRTLTNYDLVSISEGEADPRGVYNRARVNTRGGSIQDGVAVLTDVTAVFGWDQRVDDWETYLSDQSLIDSSYELVPRAQFRPWDASLVRGDDVTLDIAISLYALVWDGTPFDAGSSITSHTLEASDSWTSVSVPFGSSVTRRIEDKYEEGLFGAGGWDIWAEVRIEANAQRGLAISAVSTNLGETDGSPWSTFAAVVEIANVTGDGYDLNTARVTGEFGYDGETLLDGSGSDILAPSVDTWGERELTVNAEAFQLSPEQAAELAQGLVLHHINPRIIRTCEQSWSGGYPALQDDVGFQIDLPNGETGILQRRDYADDYRGPLSPQVSSIIEVAITEAAPYDTSSVLLDVSGGFLRDLAGNQITEV